MTFQPHEVPGGGYCPGTLEGADAAPGSKAVDAVIRSTRRAA